MLPEMLKLVDNTMDFPRYSDEWFASLYLQYGSAERAILHFMRKGETLPISIAGFHRLVNNRGIVKSVGRRHTHFAENVYFFAHKVLEPTVPLARIYRDYMPLEFTTSLVSLHRVYNKILDGKTDKQATALLISPADSPDVVLIGQEKTSHVHYGKYRGDATIPMTFSEKNEDPDRSILRVLQQEVWSSEAVKGKLKSLNVSPSFVMQFTILDVSVDVYKIILPEHSVHGPFTSFKLQGHQFISIDEIANGSSGLSFRWGVEEIINHQEISSLNLLLAKTI